MSAFRQRGSFDTGAWQRSFQFLPPMRHVACRAVAINHSHGRVSGVRQLMKNARRDKDGLAGLYGALFFSQAHLAGAFDNEIDFFLLLVVPGHLAATWLECYITQRKILRLDRACAAHQILRSPARRIGAPRDLVQIGNDQIGLLLECVSYPSAPRPKHAAACQSALIYCYCGSLRMNSPIADTRLSTRASSAAICWV